jgi:hypothetical protein
MAGSTSELSERVARNQDRFRKINEEIATTNAAHAWFEPSMPAWVCECTNEHCLEAVNLAVAEYEAVRADGTHFLVAPSAEHVVAGVERVVERQERYWVVEKVGKAGDLTEVLDDRTNADSVQGAGL